MGLSHRSAPVALLERAALTGDAVAKLLADVVASDHAAEAVVLSTCNRVEVYAEVDKFHGGLAAGLRAAGPAGRGAASTSSRRTSTCTTRTARSPHLFSVACGLDSMVVGESQIARPGPGRRCASRRTPARAGPPARRARPAGAAGRQAGPHRDRHRPRRPLAGHRRPGRAGRVLGPLDGAEVLVVGAGADERAVPPPSSPRAAPAGSSSPTAPSSAPSGSPPRSAARPSRSTELAGALAEADLVVSCTGAVGHLLSRRRCWPPRSPAARAGRWCVLDLALPRDVDPAVARRSPA